MTTRRFLFFSFFLIATVLVSPAQAGTLTTLFSADTSQDGAMFNVVVTSPVPLIVTQLDLNLATGFQGTIEIYKKSGSFVGFDTNAGAWTLVDTLINVTSAGIDQPTRVDPVDFVLAGNSTTALYITDTSGFHTEYTSGGNIGDVVASNSDLQILEGVGKEYPFGFTTPQGRSWNGTIYYELARVSVPEPSTLGLLALGLGLFWKRRRTV